MTSYSIILLLIFGLLFLLSQTTLRNKPKLFIFFTVLILSVYATLFDPLHALSNGDYTDLVRFYSDIDAFERGGWNVSESQLGTNYLLIPLSKLLVYICALLKKESLIQFFAAFIVYGLMGITLFKFSKNKTINNKYLILSFLMFIYLINFSSVIGNVRMPIGLSIFFFFLYNDLRKNYKFIWCLLGYIIAILFHPVFILFLVLRLSLLLLNKYTKISIYIVLLLSAFIIPLIFTKVSSLNNYFFVAELLYKFSYYTSINKNVTYEFYPTLFAIIQLFVASYFIVINRKYTKDNTFEKSMLNITMIFLAFSMGSFWNYHLFVRMSNFMIYFIVFWFLNSCSERKKYSTRKYTVASFEVMIYFLILFKLVYYFTSYQYNILVF